MAVTDSSSFAAFLANIKVTRIQKASLSNAVAGTVYSLWRAAGTPTQGAVPTTWATCTKALAGSFDFTNPTAPVKTYVGRFNATPANAGTLILSQRVAHMGGLSGTVVTPTAQTVNGTIPTGQGLAVDGSDAQWDLEWYTDTGSTAGTATITYTDQTDTTGRITTVSLVATTRAGRTYTIIPAAGQYIKSIQTVTLSATTGTAGSFGVTLRRVLCEAPVANISQTCVLDPTNTGMPDVPNDACLELLTLCSTTTTGVILGLLGLGQA
jgi:hypothetical protein